MAVRRRLNVHYATNWTDRTYQCLACNRRFPVEYKVKNRRSEKEWGTRQLMRLHAWHNFERHLKTCWAKKDVVFED